MANIRFHKLLCAAWIFCTPVAGLIGQKHLADSIRRILAGDIPDTSRAFHTMMLAMYTEPDDLDSAHRLYTEAVDLALSKNLKYFAGLALRFQATPYNLSGERDKEIANIMRAIDLLSSSDHPKARGELASCYGNLSTYYRMLENFDSAVNASLKAIAIMEEIGNNRKLVTACINLAMLYQALELPEKQMEYVSRALGYAKKTGEHKDLLLAYLQFGLYYTANNDHQRAKTYVDSSAPYYNEQMDFSTRQNYTLARAGTYQNLKMYDSALRYYKISYEEAKKIGSRWNICEPVMQIGYIYQQMENYGEAEKHVRIGLEVAEADSIRFFMKQGYGMLSDIYAATGNYKGAYEFRLKYDDIKDSILSEDRKKYTLDLEKRYETEKKDAQLKLHQAELQKRRILNYSLMGGAAGLLLLLGLAYRNYGHKQALQQQRIAELETEKLLTASEAVMKGEEQERSRLAKDLHDGLGGMLSGIKHTMSAMQENLVMTEENEKAFARSMDMLDSSIREMRRVAHNLMPETLVKFGLDTALRDFCNEIDQSGVLKVTYHSIGLYNASIGDSTSISIYRIIQELMNNTIKHAAATSALVQVSMIDSRISMTVEDDGIGFDTSILQGAKGIGWANIRSRVDLMKGQMDIRSGPNSGTSVHIELDT
ncbi:MAG TPA: sensor histidine kinase [Phnomibacter sp.]|nr:sensor histidine kinase [Phnomibacter sp.]